MFRKLIIWIMGREPRKEYFVDYILGDNHYCITIVADSWDDAKRHLSAIRLTGYVSGEVEF